MKKIFVVIFSVFIVSAVGYYGWNWNKTRLNQLAANEPGKSVGEINQQTGVLARNNPGQKANTWFLVNNQSGGSSEELELIFDANSECFIGRNFVECEKIDLPNGTRVMVSGSLRDSKLKVADLTAEENSDLIFVDQITNGEKIQSPFLLTGRARGNWFFEASFPVKLFSANGQIITTTIATAKGEWMTADFVPFEANLSFDVISETPAKLVLAADNPSGLPQNDREISFSVILTPPSTDRSVLLYYYDPEKDKDEAGNVLCSEKGLVTVARKIPSSDNIIFDTVALLLRGEISQEEKKQGVTTEFPLPGLKLTKVLLTNGTVTVDLTDEKNKTSGGSCRVGVLWKQIEKTVLQFPGVKEVKFIPEGLFQP